MGSYDELEKIVLDLTRTSGQLHRLVRCREEYGKTYFVYKQGYVQPYQEALHEATKELGESLERAGMVHVWREMARRNSNRIVKDKGFKEN
jgi:hypothetical protein